MKILHLIRGRCNPESPNGVDKTIYHLSRNQARLGEDVAVLNITEKTPLAIKGVNVLSASPSPFPFKLSKQAVEALVKNHPDIVHLHSVYVPENIAAGRLLRSQGIPYVVTPNGNCSSKLLWRKPWLKVPFKYIFELPLQNRSLFVHCVSDLSEVRRYGTTAPLVVIPNGVDVDEFVGGEDGEQFSERFRPLAGCRYLLFLGRLDIEQKGIDLLLEAFANLVAHNALTTLVLAGPPWKGSQSRVESMIVRLNLSERVLIAGPVFGKDKFLLLRNAFAFVHPSRWEGMSFSVLEALASGCLCIVSRAADPAGKVEHAKAGIVCDSERQSIERALRQLFGVSETERKAIRQAAVDLVRRDFDWAEIASRMIQEYRRRLSSHKGLNRALES